MGFLWLGLEVLYITLPMPHQLELSHASMHTYKGGWEM